MPGPEEISTERSPNSQAMELSASGPSVSESAAKMRSMRSGSAVNSAGTDSARARYAHPKRRAWRSAKRRGKTPYSSVLKIQAAWAGSEPDQGCALPRVSSPTPGSGSAALLRPSASNAACSTVMTSRNIAGSLQASASCSERL